MPKARKPKAAAGHQLAEKLPPGKVLVDLRKKEWVIGEPIGSGGFGLIYLAEDKSENKSAGVNSRYVIKIEPHSNGPLFSEIAFYQRAARQDNINTWLKKHKISYIGIPPYIAHGLEQIKKLRFMVMPRFGKDLHTAWISANKCFKRETVASLAINLINCLQYMHENEYVHADIKGANILLGHKDIDKVYLVDFGLAARYTFDGTHKVYKEEPKKAHDGTIEYTSIDAHLGVSPARRSDMEILGYVLVHWLCGKLPWEKDITNKNVVRDKKIESKKNIKKFISQTCNLPEMQQYMEYVKSLDYTDEPDYDKMRKIFDNVLKRTKSRKSKLDFGPAVLKESQSQSEVDIISESDETQQAKSKAKRSTASKRSTTKVDAQSSKRTPKPVAKSTQKRKTKTSTKDDELSLTKEKNSPKNKRISKQTEKLTSKRQIETSTDEEDVEQSLSEEEEETPPIKKRASKQTKTVSRKRTKGSIEEESVLISEEEDEKKPPRKSRTKRNIEKKKPVYIISSDDDSEFEEKTKSRNTARSKISHGDNKTSNKSQSASSEMDVGGTSVSAVEDSEREETPALNISNKENTTLNDDEFFDSVSPSENSSSDTYSKKPIESFKQKRSSRYSMAPLHTVPVLGKGDKLTGRTVGKHKEIRRKKRRNVPKMDADTQTTPSLRSGKVKSRI